MTNSATLENCTTVLESVLLKFCVQEQEPVQAGVEANAGQRVACSAPLPHFLDTGVPSVLGSSWYFC